MTLQLIENVTLFVPINNKNGTRYVVEICRYVKDTTMRPYFRPTLLDNQFDSQGCNVELAALVRRCWSDDPLERPDMSGIKTVLKRIDK